ncbi:unnamed protein product [Adineta ricciae]|uniref:NAD(P)(+)--arginine ADP-ribosyltransferase n=1 Tax=Adineta ricciae TaxID=249248 RepID=A0A815N7C0_ADIRI|nr:unnamed protein product [Adineta ricciae]
MNRFGDVDTESKRLAPLEDFQSEPFVPIEQSLQSIESLIANLPSYIKTAKTHCRFPSDHGLSQDESTAIYIYTMDWKTDNLYAMLNEALRSENSETVKMWFPYLKLFDSALSKLPTVKEILWRGVPLDIGSNFTKDQVVTWWSVSSCSSSVNVIKSFLEGHENATVFLIEARHGKKISGYTQYENEEEVILRMGTKFRVKSNPFKQSNNSYIVHLIEIGDNNENLSLAIATDMHKITGPFSLDSQIITTWIQNGFTIVGGNGRGNRLNQLRWPTTVYIDDDQTLYVADVSNHRILEVKHDGTHVQVVAGGNGSGKKLNQLKDPADVLIDKMTNDIIVSDGGNRRIMRWSRQNNTNGQILMSNIDCCRLVMDELGYLYVSDVVRNEVRRYGINDTRGTVVAGGNGRGSQLNQLKVPVYFFVDKEQSVYVSDRENYRVVKWLKDAKQGIVVAGGHGKGSSLSQLSKPYGIIVDQYETVYVTDSDNHRVMCWPKGAKEGSIVVGGNGRGQYANQLSYPFGLSIDGQENLYVVDLFNNRVQRYAVKRS